MNINTNSWHYKLLKYTELRVYDNLCPYVRTVILAILLSIVATIIMGFLATAALVILAAPITSWLIGFDPWEAGIMMLLWVLAGGGAIGFYRDRRKWGESVSWDRVVYEKDITYKEPSLFRLWLKAQHDKICPRLTFVNRKED